MMISKKIEEALNEQVNAELYSAYLYLSMEAYFESLNLKGFANWMRVQTLEEVTHAMKLYDHISERGGRVMLKPIKGPKTEWKSPLSVFEDAYKHEVLVTSLINNLVNLAVKEKDHATAAMLQWFIDEQVEEEASADEMRKKLELIKDTPGNLYLLDQEAAQRIFTNSAGVASSIAAKAQMKQKGGA